MRSRRGTANAPEEHGVHVDEVGSEDAAGLGGQKLLLGPARAAVLGLAESVTSTYISVRWAEAVPTILILLILLVRPQGLFTLTTRQDAAA